MNRGRRLRTVDLARAVGISTQQVRNYESLGVLPNVPRSETGYRLYSTIHKAALLTYRTLTVGHGWQTAVEIMRAVHADDESRVLELLDESHAAQQAQREAMSATEAALRDLAESDPGAAPTKPRRAMRVGELAAHLGIRASALRFWEEAGLLHPERDPATKYRQYGPTQLRDARIIQLLRNSHYRFPEIEAILDSLRQKKDVTALNETLSRQREQLQKRAWAMLHGAQQLHDYLIQQREPVSDPR